MNPNITLLNVQLLFRGPLEYNRGMLNNLHMKIHIQTRLPSPHLYILKAHVDE